MTSGEMDFIVLDQCFKSGTSSLSLIACLNGDYIFVRRVEKVRTQTDGANPDFQIIIKVSQGIGK